MNTLAFFSLGIFLIIVQSNAFRLLNPIERTLREVIPVAGISPSLILPLVIFLGVHEPSVLRAALLASVLGYALDLFSGAPTGLFAFVFVAVCWLSRMAGVRLAAQTLITQVVLAFGFALLEAAIVLTLLAIFGTDSRRPLEIATGVLPHAVATALFAPLIFGLARRLPPSGGGHARVEVDL